MAQVEYPDLWIVLHEPSYLHDEENRRGTFGIVVRTQADAFECMLEMGKVTAEDRRRMDLFFPRRDAPELCGILRDFGCGDFRVFPVEEYVSRWDKLKLPESLRIERFLKDGTASAPPKPEASEVGTSPPAPMSKPAEGGAAEPKYVRRRLSDGRVRITKRRTKEDLDRIRTRYALSGIRMASLLARQRKISPELTDALQKLARSFTV